mmetsp:Transcript_40187/g.46836  ORF Transcript_40187/g.46836 Transcript_40187/m.46836 type:complete len:178 (+) Transcript_40187:33-566(+)
MIQLFKQVTRRMAPITLLAASTQASLLVYTPKRYILHDAKRLKTKPKYQEFEIPYVARETFELQSTILLNRLEDAFNQLKVDEPRISSIKRDDFIEENLTDEKKINTLTVTIDDLGVYEFKVFQKEKLVYVLSPVGGINKYYFDEPNERWVSNRDKHFLEELLVRETTKKCKGLLPL